ncbi:hypothetical protein NKS27_17420 [Peribacillus frigoritolerans]|uniref:hypothetical protein n=1 Tax=Peribacillus frigoritolerans TaxID=450367 RepID=UPI00209CD966|nr:hypothetical protein [Peribacillus frigoritolerans]MCP1154173.1 hypothetical protein [Peribacillus frigoritolerans]
MEKEIVANAMDSYHDKTRLYGLNYNSLNYDTSEITRNSDNTLSVTGTGQFKNMFESGFIPIESDFGVEIHSDATIWRAIVEFYDASMTRIIVDTPSAIASGELVWSTSNNYYWASTNKKDILFAIFKNTAVKYIKLRIQPHLTGVFNYLNIEVRKTQNAMFKFDSDGKYNKLRSSTLPIAGTYTTGDYVEKLGITEIGTVGAKYSVYGWKRVTTGNTHVLNTDWFEDRRFTGN